MFVRIKPSGPIAPSLPGDALARRGARAAEWFDPRRDLETVQKIDVHDGEQPCWLRTRAGVGQLPGGKFLTRRHDGIMLRAVGGLRPANGSCRRIKSWPRRTADA